MGDYAVRLLCLGSHLSISGTGGPFGRTCHTESTYILEEVVLHGESKLAVCPTVTPA